MKIQRSKCTFKLPEASSVLSTSALGDDIYLLSMKAFHALLKNIGLKGPGCLQSDPWPINTML